MEVIPAIDLLDGRVVRLSQGDFDAVTDYGDDPVEVARRWAADGAARIHIVDLDAARHGRPRQRAVVERIVEAIDARCQVAGGIRSEADVASTLDGGADRVVLGTALISDPDLARRLVAAPRCPSTSWPRSTSATAEAVGDGWVEGARSTGAKGLAWSLVDAGVVWLAVTAISRDGGMEGPDLALLEAIRTAVPGASIIASGGIGGLDDIRALAGQGYGAAIVGRALYEGAFSLPEALEAARASHI